MPSPLVSIGMPVYNGERYLEAAIRSNLDQTVDDFELIISDNASTDGTEAICQAFAATDQRVRYFRNESNVGAAANYNRLFKLARAEYFRWSNADDLVDRHLLERTLPVLASRPDVSIVYGATRLIDDEGNTIEEYADCLDLQDELASHRYKKFFLHAGLTNIIYGLMRSSAMGRSALMGSGKLPAGDVRFMAEMILLGKFVELPEVLFCRRIHEDAMSSKPDEIDKKQFWNASRTRFVLPSWRTEFVDLRAIIRAPLPYRETLRLLAYSAKRFFWQLPALAKDVAALLPFGRNG